MKVVVKPADDGMDMRSNWVVEWKGKRSGHVKKSAAKRKAREVGSVGDTLEVRRTDGTIQKTVTMSGSRSSNSSSSSNGSPYGVETADVGLGDFFNP